jgi:hypothetical protein
MRMISSFVAFLAVEKILNKNFHCCAPGWLEADLFKLSTAVSSSDLQPGSWTLLSVFRKKITPVKFLFT